MTTKNCSQCNEEKSLAEFQKAKGYKDGYTNQCKKCRYQKTRAWLKADPDRQKKANEANRIWYENNPEYFPKYREKNRGRINQNLREVRRGEREPIRPGPMRGKKRPDITGEKNPNWKGGISSLRDQAMATLEYRVWRQTVLKRDGFQCVLCPETKQLQVHHIKMWSENEELRYDPDNGVALCVRCHWKVKGCENEFEQRFSSYVANRVPIELTEKEKASLTPFETICSFCNTPLIRPPWKRTYKFHFCNLNCKKGFEKTIGTNWRGLASHQ